MDSFTRAYIETALWSTTDNSREDGGDPFDQNYSADDIAPAALAAIERDCAAFQAANAELIRDCVRKGEWDISEQAGHDFWLTRCGHGAGFWDGDWPETGDALTVASKAYGNVDPYLGDDGLIYGFGE